MKSKILVILLLLWISIFSVQAQNRGINYKAVISEAGSLLQNHNVTLKFTILKDNRINLYEETHAVTTDDNGIVVANIGEGTLVSGDTNNINFLDDIYYNVAIDTGSGYTDMGTHQFKAVPYAMVAKKAEAVSNPLWTSVSNGINSADAIGVGVGTTLNANLHMIDVTGGLPLLKMESNDNIYTIWQSNRAGVDDYQIGIDGGNNKFIFSDITTSKYPLTIQSDKVGINNLDPIANLHVKGSVLFDNGSQGIGKVLTSDAQGFATWQSISTGSVNINDLTDAIYDGSSLFIGNSSGINTVSSAFNNLAVGENSFYSNTTGSQNTAIGSSTLYSSTEANGNTAVGYANLNAHTSGGYNATLGYASFFKHETGANNTSIGAYTGYNNLAGSGNVFIGYFAGYNETGNNKLYIENSNTSDPLIGGDFSTNEVTINGSLSIKDGTQAVGKVLSSDVNGKGTWKYTTHSIIYSPSQVEVFTNNVDYIKGTSYFYFQTTNQNQGYIGINLPLNSIITNVTYYYLDNNSTRDIRFQVYKTNLISGGSSTYAASTSSGTNSVVRTSSIATNILVEDQYAYSFVIDANALTWPGDNTLQVRGVKLTYEIR
jgi:hypothetical protein